MTVGTLERTEKPAEDSACRHYWLLKSPGEGPLWGVCKYCGRRRQFHTLAEDLVREEERTAHVGFWGVGDLEQLARLKDGAD